jgi:hypothetical protein
MDMKPTEATKRLMDIRADRKATRVIADYRESRNCNLTPMACCVLDRLAKDPAGVVTAALNNRTLKPAHPGLLLFYLIQSVEIAETHEEVTEECTTKADDFKSAAFKIEELAKFCYGNVSLHLYYALRELEKELNEQSAAYSKRPAELHINQKTTADSRSLLALRAFAARLRKNFGLKRLPHDAMKWLIGTALGRDVTDNQVTEGLRLPEVGQIDGRKRQKSPNRRKPMKSKEKFSASPS